MQGLRKPEGEKFERFFMLVQEEALNKGGVFFADCGEGNEFENEFMEGENLSGWLIPLKYVKEFEHDFNKVYDPKGWDNYLCWALWENKDNLKITFEWCRDSKGF